MLSINVLFCSIFIRIKSLKSLNISTSKCLCFYWNLHTCQSSLDSGRSKTYPRQINIEQNKIIIDLNLFNTIKNLEPEYDTFPEYQINGYFPQILCIYYYFYRAGPP